MSKISSARQQRIEKVLFAQLLPSYLKVDNESHQHQVPEGAETHFKVIAVSQTFASLTRISRHRQVNQLLATEFSTGMHALSLHLYTPKEWAELQTSPPKSPPCQKVRK